MAVVRRRVLLPGALLAAIVLCFWNLATGLGWSKSFATAAGQRSASLWRACQPTQGRRDEIVRASPTATKARGGEDDEAESVEVAGFSSFVVGLALLPHVINCLVVSFGIIVSGNSFVLGPYGLELISCTTTLGLVTWSVGSFIERGRGLPAGPLGLLGLSEGLSYIGALLLVLAGLVSNTRGPVQVAVTTAVPAPTQITVPAPTTAPSVKTPEVKKPEVKAPEPKKAPEAPPVKAPEVKKPEVKAPAPEVKKPEVKAPEPTKAPEAPAVKKPEVKAPEPKKALEAKPAASSTTSYDDLFD